MFTYKQRIVDWSLRVTAYDKVAISLSLPTIYLCTAKQMNVSEDRLPLCNVIVMLFLEMFGFFLINVLI